VKAHARLTLIAAVLTLGACKESPLYSELTEQQANEIEAVLLASGINTDKSRAEGGDGWAVSVAKSDLPRAMRLLRARGLPQAERASIGEVFEKKGFVSSPLEERARYLYALSEEMSQTLMQIDGVVSARVHIALPEKDLLSNTEESASASVVIIQEPGTELGTRETDIKAIVTDGIEGLDDVNRVTVKFFDRGPPTDDAEIIPASVNSSQRLQASLGSGGLMVMLLCGVAVFAIALWQWFRRRRDGDVESPEGRA
jgi:type III secretion protein J